ncbi:hypothetical protein K7432_012952 [Basidiobolus ranarum]|uniref:Uncharacterized protein n=1 Tax=Basidiobolus ranarum TaxID=34480 RepID=A0ABR2WK03_9FUNG
MSSDNAERQQIEETKAQEQRLEKFVRQNESAEYILDDKTNELCRTLSDGRQNCLKLSLDQKEMFSMMQKLNFFCTLPLEPEKTHIICKKV